MTAQRPPLGVADLAIGGEDVIAEPASRGAYFEIRLPRGPEVGRILRELLDRVTDDPAVNDRAALLALVDELATCSISRRVRRGAGYVASWKMMPSA